MAIQLTLTIKGKAKVFTADGVNMRASIEAFKLLGECEASGGGYTEELINRLIGFVVLLFNRKFSEDELLDSCLDSFFRIVPAMLTSVVKGINEAFPVNPTMTAETGTTA